MARNLSNFKGREMMLNLHDHVLNMKYRGDRFIRQFMIMASTLWPGDSLHRLSSQSSM